MKHVHVWDPSASGSARTLLMLHGTGGDENDLLAVAQAVDPDANVLSPRGRVLENGAPRFFARFGPGKLDVEDLKRRTHDLADFVLEASKDYGFDPARLVVFGYSNGANIGASLLFLRPEVLAGAVLARAMMPYEPAKPPRLAGKRALLLAGEHDPYSQRPVTERLAAVLREAGAEVAVNLAPSGHDLTPADVALARRWVQEGP